MSTMNDNTNNKNSDVEKKIDIEAIRAAAESGDAEALFTLSQCYLRGEGVETNLDEAVQWLHKAAERGHARAQSSLGVCYLYGEGEIKNEAEAVRWFRKSAEQDDFDGLNNLGACYLCGTGIAQDVTAAVQCFRRSAELGNEDAMTNLGICYSEGLGVRRNRVRAAKWFDAAARAKTAGYTPAGLPFPKVALSRRKAKSKSAADRKKCAGSAERARTKARGRVVQFTDPETGETFTAKAYNWFNQ